MHCLALDLSAKGVIRGGTVIQIRRERGGRVRLYDQPPEQRPAGGIARLWSILRNVGVMMFPAWVWWTKGPIDHLEDYVRDGPQNDMLHQLGAQLAQGQTAVVIICDSVEIRRMLAGITEAAISGHVIQSALSLADEQQLSIALMPQRAHRRGT